MIEGSWWTLLSSPPPPAPAAAAACVLVMPCCNLPALRPSPPHCLLQYILALKQCHAGHPVAKFWGVCNDAAKALNVCLQEEKVEKR
jgi:hypothetical protein